MRRMERQFYGHDIDRETGIEALAQVTVREDGTQHLDVVLVEPEPQEPS